MKTFFKKVTLFSLATLTMTVGLGACKSNVQVPVTFVAATASVYNADVVIGDYSYKFKGTLDQKSNDFVLVGTVQARSSGTSSGGGPGGFPGGGFPGGGFPGGGGQSSQPGGGGPTVAVTGVSVSLDMTEAFINQQVKATATVTPDNASNKEVTWSVDNEEIATINTSGTITPKAAGTVVITAKSKSDSTIFGTASLLVKVEDLAAYDYEMKGTYTVDKGYGFILKLDDADKTVIHTDFNKTEGRHEFYYNVTIGEKSSLIKFQAKHAKFREQLAKDYEIWDVRNSEYIFHARATGNNNSLAYAYMYMHKDGNVVIDSPSGVNRVKTFGLTWEKDGDKIVLKSGDQRFETVASINPAHPGYKLVYNNVVYLLSTNPDVKWRKMTQSDFDGATTYEFTGSYTTLGPDGGSKTVNLNLGVDGNAYLYSGSWVASATGTWTEADEVITVTLGDKTYTSEKDADGNRFIIYQVEVRSWGGTSIVDVRLMQTK